MADQKKQASTNGEFKTSPLGFDKAEVMAYIVQHNKERKALKEENDELKRALENMKNEAPSEDANAEIEKKKAELDAQILESRKQILDERRKLAQTEKELHTLQDKYKSVTDEFAAYKKQTSAKLQKAKKSGGTIDPAQLAEISAKANADANAVIEDAQNKANEIITAAKAYFADTVQKTYDYKQSVLDKADAFAENVTSGGAGNIDIDVAALLEKLKNNINDTIREALSDAESTITDSLQSEFENANQSVVAASEEATEAPEQKLSDDEELITAKAELENIGGFNESELDAYVPLQIEPYAFELKLDLPAESGDDSDDFEDDEVLSDNGGLLSSFEIVASDDDDITSDTAGSDDLLVEDTAASGNTASDDFSELIEEEPVITSAPTAPADPAADDFSDLLAEEPVVAPAPAAKEEAPAADDFSDLLADIPEQKSERSNERGIKPKEKLNESRAMGVAGKDTPENDPWKELEAQMNGMTITPPPSKPAASSDDDGMTSSYDDSKSSSSSSEKEEKIDMSDYSSMLDGINDNMTTNTAQYDPTWDLKMMEGLKDDDDDDEMSSDNVGFFDL